MTRKITYISICWQRKMKNNFMFGGTNLLLSLNCFTKLQIIILKTVLNDYFRMFDFKNCTLVYLCKFNMEVQHNQRNKQCVSTKNFFTITIYSKMTSLEPVLYSKYFWPKLGLIYLHLIGEYFTNQRKLKSYILYLYLYFTKACKYLRRFDNKNNSILYINYGFIHAYCICMLQNAHCYNFTRK